MNQTIKLCLGAASLLVASMSALAADSGRVLFAEGDTYAVRGGRHVALQKDSTLMPGDSLVTGDGARLQWAMGDNSLYALPGNSTMNVDAFSMGPAGNARAGGGTMFMSLLKGAFRTVSGLVGKRRNDDYRINSPVATIGIRGTEYYIVYCNDDCQQRINNKPGGGVVKTANVKVPNGLYVGVDRGIVVVTNDGGTYEFRAGQYGYVASRKKAPVLLDKRPSIFDAIADGTRFEFDPAIVDNARNNNGEGGSLGGGSVDIGGSIGGVGVGGPPPRVEPPPPPPPVNPPPPVSPN